MSIASENREGGNRAVDLVLVSLPVDALMPYEGNAKKHEEPDIRAIAESIKAFGFSDPIGIWGPDNLIVEGHGRLLAAKECGLDTVPCIRLDHLSADERRAYALAHNKTAELSGWDLDALDVELDALSESFAMEAFGFASALKIDWTRVEDLSADTYQEPEHEMLECPFCHHVDRKIHFKKVREKIA